MTSIDSDTDLKGLAAQARVNSLAVLGVPVAVFAALAAWLGTPQVLPAALGAAGWMIALALRQPIALIASRITTRDRAMTVVGWASGPAEEVVRLLLVLFVLRTGSAAAWAGAGWMAVEVAMITVNGLMIATLLTKDDPKSLEAKDFLSKQGMMQSYGPWWGVLERAIQRRRGPYRFHAPALRAAMAGPGDDRGSLGHQHAGRSLLQAIDRSHGTGIARLGNRRARLGHRSPGAMYAMKTLNINWPSPGAYILAVSGGADSTGTI